MGLLGKSSPTKTTKCSPIKPPAVECTNGHGMQANETGKRNKPFCSLCSTKVAAKSLYWQCECSTLCVTCSEGLKRAQDEAKTTKAKFVLTEVDVKATAAEEMLATAEQALAEEVPTLTDEVVEVVEVMPPVADLNVGEALSEFLGSRLKTEEAATMDEATARATADDALAAEQILLAAAAAKLSDTNCKLENVRTASVDKQARELQEAVVKAVFNPEGAAEVVARRLKAREEEAAEYSSFSSYSRCCIHVCAHVRMCAHMQTFTSMSRPGAQGGTRCGGRCCAGSKSGSGRKGDGGDRQGCLMGFTGLHRHGSI